MSVYLKRANGAEEFIAGGLSGGSAASMYDGGLSTISDNAVQNKVITIAVNGLRSDIGNIQNDIISINGALSDVDNEPTQNSTKFVRSGGVYTAIKDVNDKLKNTITDQDQALPESEIVALISEIKKLKPVDVTSDPSTLVLDKDHSVYAYGSDDSATALTNFPDNSLRNWTILALGPGNGIKDPELMAINDEGIWFCTERTTTGLAWDKVVFNGDLANFFNDIQHLNIAASSNTPLVSTIERDSSDPKKLVVTSTTVGSVEGIIEEHYDTAATENSTHALTSGAIYDIKENLQTQIDALEGARIYKGSVASVPSLSDVQVGWVYNITDAFTTTDDFVEGAGIEVTAGSDIACVNTGTADSPILKWDIMADTSLFQRKQLTTALQIGNNPKVTTVEEALTKVSNIVPTGASTSYPLLMDGTVNSLTTKDWKNDVDDAWTWSSSPYGNSSLLELYETGTVTAPVNSSGLALNWHWDDDGGMQMWSNVTQRVPALYMRKRDPDGPWMRMPFQQAFTFTKAANSTSTWAVFRFSNQHVVNFNLPLIMTIGGNGYFGTYIINRFRAYAFKDRSNWLSKIMLSDATVTPGYIALEIAGTAAYSGRVEFTHIGQIPDTLTFVGMKTQAEMLSLMNASAVDNILESVDGTFSWPTTTTVGATYSETVDVKGTEGLLAIAGWATSGQSYRNLYYLSYEPRQNTPVIRLIQSGLGEQTGNPITSISATRSGTTITLNIQVSSTNNLGTYIKLTPMNE